MASTYITFSLDLDGEPAKVRHHCHHLRGSSSWAIETTHQGSVYFDATGPQLRAFAQELLSAIDRAETDARRIAVESQQSANTEEVVQS